MTRTETPVPLRIARQADLTPDAIAARGPEGELTYRLLDRRARALARELRAAGAGPEDTVLLGVRRGLHWAVGVLGIWYAGAALLPVDLDTPDERLRTLTDAAGTRYAVAPGHLAAADLQRRCGRELFWAGTDGRPQEEAGREALPEPAACDPDSLAYVLFTSGSTGRPKPVAVAHRSLAAQSAVLAERYALTRADRVLQFAAPAFDVALEEALPTWCTGGAAVFVEDNVLSPAELEPFLAERGVSVVNLPTPYWAQWAKDVERRPRQLPADLRRVVIGSDAGRTADLKRWAAAGGPPVVSCYGLTESTITATSYEAGPAELLALTGDEVIPLGTPLPGVRAYVLDEALTEAPAGAAGELYLAGDCLARGYHGRPAPTSERFVADPFGRRPGERMYRTGDRVRRTADGTLEFLGRADDQVKIRGFRVELKEVEAAVAAHPDVLDVVARAVRDRGEPQVAAYVVTVPGSTLDGRGLRGHLARRVPGHLVPAHIVILAELPRTPGGKLDPRALPALPSPAAATVSR
ncbi:MULTISPECIES: amino acid adenylation domain-containing protein [unclassified Streptomyces]|uniref:amino acid adenylation domain-containing protein n=1 Tax=unclassified Streptomyces TaxID=2593676 RepID=UPI002E34BBEC|nr:MULTISPECIES: amino acid adenylation domain-containing protein [unclassified Streptomyces]WUC63329.1 amino acid adenylation domain-containing protein [Streptomyces sp. NBC_00539]